jgi:hypothetical protein
MLAITAGLSLGITNFAMAQKRGATLPQTNAGFAVPYKAQLDPLFQMTRVTFSQYLSTRFTIDPGYISPVETTLIEVKDLRPAADIKKNLPGKECFRLTFKATSEVSRTVKLKQGTFQVKHDALGSFELFVVPSEDKEGDVFFEAIINRLVP